MQVPLLIEEYYRYFGENALEMVKKSMKMIDL